jgi:hypothetical protein
MWYLSKNQSGKLEKLSRDLIAKNGWADQFAVTNRVMSELFNELTKLNLGQTSRYKVRKELVDTLIVLQHPINHLKISEYELANVGLVGDVENEAKIPRIYRRVMDITYVPKADLHTELDIMAKKVMETPVKNNAYDRSKRQIYLVAEELLELMKELSKYVRIQDTRGTTDYKEKKLSDNRAHIVAELFDILYTMRYVMLAQDITPKQINQLAAMRIKDIRDRELGR